MPEESSGRLPLSRRRMLAALGATGVGAAGLSEALGGGDGQGRLFGGKMALSQAYKFAEGPDGAIWIGPDSAKNNVAAESGSVYMASDTEVDYYGDGGMWVKRSIGSSSEPVPEVHSQSTITESAVIGGGTEVNGVYIQSTEPSNPDENTIWIDTS